MTCGGWLVLVIEWIALLRPLDTLRMRLASYGSVGDCAFAPLNNRQLSACRRGACHAGIYHRISRTSQLFLREPGTVWRAFSDVFPWEASPMNLHADMFLPTLQSQCSEQQKDLWLSRAERFEIIGTYAQSELGHGMCPFVHVSAPQSVLLSQCSSVSAPPSVLLSQCLSVCSPVSMPHLVLFSSCTYSQPLRLRNDFGFAVWVSNMHPSLRRPQSCWSVHLSLVVNL